MIRGRVFNDFSMICSARSALFEPQTDHVFFRAALYTFGFVMFFFVGAPWGFPGLENTLKRASTKQLHAFATPYGGLTAKQPSSDITDKIASAELAINYTC